MSEYPWRRIGRTDYVLIERCGSAPKGFVFQVSVPRCLEWLISPHDPEWLWIARRHDTRLHLHGWPAGKAAWAFLDDAKTRLTQRRWIAYPAFAGVYIWTTSSRIIRRIFPWKEA